MYVEMKGGFGALAQNTLRLGRKDFSVERNTE